LAWQRRARGLVQEALDQDRPGYVRELLGPVPESIRGRRACRQAIGAIEAYRDAYQVPGGERGLGPQPREPAQRVAWQQARAAVDRVHDKQRAERDRQPTTACRPASTDRQAADPAASAHVERDAGVRRRGPERAAG